MFVCVFVDEINDSFGPDSIDDNRQIVCVSDDVDKIKKHVAEQNDGSTVEWIQDEEISNRWIGTVMYDDEPEDQQYIICQTIVV